MLAALKAGIFIGMVLLVGAGVFARFVGPEVLTPKSRRRLRIGLLAGAALLLIASLLEVAFALQRTVGFLEPALLADYFVSTRHGQAALLRSGLLLLLILLGLGSLLPRRADRVLHVLLSLALLATVSWVSHSGVMGLWPLLGDLAHLVGAVVWAGALLYLAWAAGWRENQEPLVRAVRRVSALGLMAVGLLMLTGLYMSLLHMAGLTALSTSYGEMLVVKLTLVLIILLVAAANRFVLVPMLERRERRTPLKVAVRAESLLLVGVLVATGMLATREPPHDHGGQLALGGFDHDLNVDHDMNFDHDVDEAYVPLLPGRNSLTLPAGTLVVTPTEDGSLALQLRSEDGAALQLTALTPGGQAAPLVHAETAQPFTEQLLLPYHDLRLALPREEAGVWQLQGDLGGSSFQLPFTIARATTPSGVRLGFYLVPTPEPDDVSELFVSALQDGEPFSGPVFLRYYHASAAQEDSVAFLRHKAEHASYGAGLRSSSLHFPRAGLWELEFNLAGEAVTIAVEVAAQAADSSLSGSD